MNLTNVRGLCPVLSAALFLTAPTALHTYVFGRASFVTGNSPIALARGDLDGELDMAVANLSDSLSVFVSR